MRSEARARRTPIDTPGRIYSDEEFARILQRAAELQDRAEGATGRRPESSSGARRSDGLSLEVVRDIAQEVGLEPRFVDQAAAALAREPAANEFSLLGGSRSYNARDTYARTLTAAEQVELLDVIREALGHHGEVREVMGSLEWRTVGRVSQTRVTVHSSDEDVSVRVFHDLSGLALVAWAAPIAIGLAIGIGVVDANQPSTLLAFALLGAWLGVGVGVARTIWSATTRFFRRRAERLREEIADHLTR